MERYFVIKHDRSFWRYMLCRGDDYPRCDIVEVYMTLRGARRGARRHARDQMTVVWDSAAELADEAERSLKRGLVVR